MVVAVVA